MRDVDRMASEATKDSQKLDEFIAQHEFFILKSASKIAKHFVTKNDDEWSVALFAFSEALNKYQYERGSFFAFAQLMIRRNLIDYYRVQGKYSAEVHVEGSGKDAVADNNDLKLEIEAIGQILESYGFTFMDLTACSPKAKKTKAACGKAVNYLLDKPVLLKEMQSSKLLPVKLIEKKAGVHRKILERHRKYIIAATEILHGEYPYLSQYLSWMNRHRDGSSVLTCIFLLIY